MITTSQDVLYLTVAVCIATFTATLIWIMYYVGQITKQSNEMISDFRTKLEDLDRAIHAIQDKVSRSVDVLATLSNQVSNVVEIVRGVTTKAKRKK